MNKYVNGELKLVNEDDRILREMQIESSLKDDLKTKYARDRAEAYPSLEDQADMAYWDRKNGTTTLDDAITAVKSAYPKT
jgi:hypothetical protein